MVISPTSSPAARKSSSASSAVGMARSGVADMERVPPSTRSARARSVVGDAVARSSSCRIGARPRTGSASPRTARGRRDRQPELGIVVGRPVERRADVRLLGKDELDLRGRPASVASMQRFATRRAGESTPRSGRRTGRASPLHRAARARTRGSSRASRSGRPCAGRGSSRPATGACRGRRRRPPRRLRACSRRRRRRAARRARCSSGDEQVVGPLDRRPQRLLAGVGVAAALEAGRAARRAGRGSAPA